MPLVFPGRICGLGHEVSTEAKLDTNAVDSWECDRSAIPLRCAQRARLRDSCVADNDSPKLANGGHDGVRSSIHGAGKADR